MDGELNKGLEGVLIAESELSSVDGDAGRLIYQGYAIEDLARGASYEEVLYLLWYNELPGETELTEFTEMMAAERAADEDILEITYTCGGRRGTDGCSANHRPRALGIRH